MTKREMECEIFNMSYEEMCKYIFKKNMDKEIESERRRYMNVGIITNEKIAESLIYDKCSIAESLIYDKCSLEEIIDGINRFKQDCANKFEIGEIVKNLSTKRLGIIIEIPEEPFDKYKVLDFYKLNTHNMFKTNEYTASELAAFSKRKICKDIKKIVETGKIDDD